MGHRVPVGLDQEVFRQIRVEVQSQSTAQSRGAPRLLKGPLETLQKSEPSPFRAPRLRKSYLPSFLGQTQAEAEATATSAGLIAVFLGEIETADPALVGRVVEQDPATGTTVDDGSQVGLFLGIPLPTTTTSTTSTTTSTTAAP